MGLPLAIEVAKTYPKHGKKRSSYRVLLTLATYANERRLAWPSVTSLMVWVRVDRTTVQRALRTLEEDGWIESNGAHPHDRSTVYRLVGPAWPGRNDAPPPGSPESGRHFGEAVGVRAAGAAPRETPPEIERNGIPVLVSDCLSRSEVEDKDDETNQPTDNNDYNQSGGGSASQPPDDVDSLYAHYVAAVDAPERVHASCPPGVRRVLSEALLERPLAECKRAVDGAILYYPRFVAVEAIFMPRLDLGLSLGARIQFFATIATDGAPPASQRRKVAPNGLPFARLDTPNLRDAAADVLSAYADYQRVPGQPDAIAWFHAAVRELRDLGIGTNVPEHADRSMWVCFTELGDE